jgi:hypothetical protein
MALHGAFEPVDEGGEGNAGDGGGGDDDVVPTRGEVDVTTCMSDATFDAIPDNGRPQSFPGDQPDPGDGRDAGKADNCESSHRLPVASTHDFTEAYGRSERLGETLRRRDACGP